MTRSFGDAAARLAGLATRMLGWPPQAFWETTPAELAAIFDNDDGQSDAPLSRAELDAMMEGEKDG